MRLLCHDGWPFRLASLTSRQPTRAHLAYRRIVTGGASFDSEVAATAAELERLVRRLRSLSRRAWKDRRPPAQTALDGLVALDAQLEQRELESPTVADHVIPDAVALIGGDVLDAVATTGNADALEAVRRLIGEALVATR